MKISTCSLLGIRRFWPVVSEVVELYFTRFLRTLTFCLGVSKIVILKKWCSKIDVEIWSGMEIRDSEK